MRGRGHKKLCLLASFVKVQVFIGSIGKILCLFEIGILSETVSIFFKQTLISQIGDSTWRIRLISNNMYLPKFKDESSWTMLENTFIVNNKHTKWTNVVQELLLTTWNIFYPLLLFAHCCLWTSKSLRP